MSRVGTSTGPLWKLWGERFTDGLVASAGFIVAGTLCFRAALISTKADHRFWLTISALLALLAVDRFFGLLPRISRLARRALREGGWYWPYRRPIQAILTLAIIIGLVFAVSAPRWCFGVSGLVHLGTWYMTAALCGFVLIRSVSLHEIDDLLYRRRRWLPMLPVNLFIELTGTVAICMLVTVP